MNLRLASFALFGWLACAAAAAAQPLPSRADVEGALVWESGRVCRQLIDACLDEDGNDLYATPEFDVAALECEPAGDGRASCSFTSVRRFGPDRAEPSERCTGTLVRHDHDGGETSWSFFVPEPRRRPYAVLLSCH